MLGFGVEVGSNSMLTVNHVHILASIVSLSRGGGAASPLAPMPVRFCPLRESED